MADDTKKQTKTIKKTAKKKAGKPTDKSLEKAAPKAAPEADQKSTKPAITMADLLADNDYAITIAQPGDIVQGVIVSIAKKMAVIDVGGKTEGLVVDREFQQAEDFISELKPGDKVDAYVLEKDDNNGQIMLSLKKAMQDKKWNKIIKEQGDQSTIEVESIETNRGGMVVVYEGIRGFIPTSQFGRQVSGKLDSLKGKNIKVKILEVDKEKNRLIFSERLVSEADELANAEQALTKISEGDIVEGVITGIKPFGIFVAVEVPLSAEEKAKKSDDQSSDKIGVLEGLVHISEVSWDKVEDLSSLFSKGQRIKTQVLAVSEEHGKLTLSIKQLKDDPWEDFSKNNPAGTIIDGEVSKVVPFGVFVSLASGIEGLIHESKLSGEPYATGDKVSVVIDSVDTDQRRVRLSPATTDVPVTYK